MFLYSGLFINPDRFSVQRRELIMRYFYNCLPVLVAATCLVAIPASAALTVTIEAAGVQNTTTTFSTFGIENFDSYNNGVQNLTTDYGTGGAIVGNYAGAVITSADQFGGAGGTGKYISADANLGSASYTLTFTAGSVDYFGMWFSAASVGNVISFYNGSTLVGAFSPDHLISLVGPAYYGNPNDGLNTAQPYAFVNFYDTTGTFDKIVFTSEASGLESDNHTVGTFMDLTGTVVSAVPEPSMWLTLGLGTAIIGWTARRRPTRMRAAESMGQSQAATC